MAAGETRTGVCVVRVEAQTHGLLITLRLNPEIERFSTGVSVSTADAESAVQIVREFLLDFLAATPDQ
ncbi:hypothetical protein [Streptomyces sp. H27-D2]|uniref:hypothetical protein n=1 Tax=Streptomyces sp. H27-D2 TaxID=3046304 RepID=UPI002DBB61E0|nr:hypothetical protein [Streptomyces sp. H27-D2]MEC4018793.1 hypothetical protein [Streptomyces sp. H27-D2]